jgi:large subunit ribosomal protein L18
MPNIQRKTQLRRARRKNKVRAKIQGTTERPRLAVHRSLKHIQVQIINDEQGKTVLSIADNALSKEKLSGTKVAIAKELGKLTAEKALAKKVKQVVFDRRGLAYHGRIKALAEGAREGGLKF